MCRHEKDRPPSGCAVIHSACSSASAISPVNAAPIADCPAVTSSSWSEPRSMVRVDAASPSTRGSHASSAHSQKMVTELGHADPRTGLRDRALGGCGVAFGPHGPQQGHETPADQLLVTGGASAKISQHSIGVLITDRHRALRQQTPWLDLRPLRWRPSRGGGHGCGPGEAADAAFSSVATWLAIIQLELQRGTARGATASRIVPGASRAAGCAQRRPGHGSMTKRSARRAGDATI